LLFLYYFLIIIITSKTKFFIFYLKTKNSITGKSFEISKFPKLNFWYNLSYLKCFDYNRISYSWTISKARHCENTEEKNNGKTSER